MGKKWKRSLIAKRAEAQPVQRAPEPAPVAAPVVEEVEEAPAPRIPLRSSAEKKTKVKSKAASSD